jgi:TolA-binding protein
VKCRSLYITVYAFFLISFSASALDTLQTAPPDTLAVEEFQFAVRLYNEEFYDLALEHFRRITDTRPASPQGIESRYYLGLIYRAMGEPENSRLTLQTFALTYPDHPRAPDAWWNIAETHADAGRYADAGATLERLLQFHPEHSIIPRALYQASIWYERAGDTHRAEDFVEHIILRYSRSDFVLPARIRFGNFRLRNDDYESASAVFRRVLSDIPNRAVDSEAQNNRAAARLGLAQSLLRSGYIERAESEYSAIIETFSDTPSYPDAVFGRAEAASRRGAHLDAIDRYREAQTLAAEIKNIDLARKSLLGSAETYRNLGDYSSALTFYDLYARTYAAESTKDELRMIRLGAAESSEHIKDYHRAVEWWNRLVDSDDREIRERAHIRAAVNNESLGEYTEAAALYRKYAETFNDDVRTPEALFRLGNVYENHIGDHRRALSAYEELGYRFPDSRFIDDALLGQARMNLKIGNDAQAHHLAVEFPKRFPGSDLLEDASRLKDEIETYHLLDRDGGFQSITFLMSEMIAGTARGELAVNLGDIYLEKLKQYPEAARQFETALSLDLPSEKRNHAEHQYAYSLYKMAGRSPEQRSEAMARLRDLSDRNPRSQHAELISFYYLDLLRSVAGSAEFLTAAERYLQTHRRPEYGDKITLYVAEIYEKIPDDANAADHYRTLIRSFPNSPHAAGATFKLARLTLAAGDTSAANELLVNYTRRYQDGTDVAGVYFLLGDIASERGNHTHAAEFYGQIADRIPYHTIAYYATVRYAQALLNAGRNDAAFKVYIKLISRTDTDYFADGSDVTDLLYPAGTAAYRSGDTETAMRLYERFLQRENNTIEAGKAALLLGELNRKKGNTYFSERYYMQAESILTEGQTTRDIAELLFVNRQYRPAAQHMTRLAQQSNNPDEKKEFEAKAIIALFRAGRADEARPRVQAFTAAYPQERDSAIEFEYEAAMHLFRTRSYDNAAAAFQRFIQQHGNSAPAPSAHFYLGRTWEAVGRLTNAQQKYEEILQKHPRADIIPNVKLAYGGLLLRQQKVAEAIDQYRFVLETSRDDDELMYYILQNVIAAYEEIGFFEPALELTEEFIRRYPSDESIPNMRVKVGILNQRAKYFEQSIAVFQSLILTASRDIEAELRYYTGDSYYMLGNYRRAIQEFLTVPDLDTRTSQPDWTATAIYMAGQSYERLGAPDDAIAMYQRIIDARGTDQTYKAAARKEIDRVRSQMRQATQ